MSYIKRPIHRDPLFTRPLLVLVGFLTLALLFFLLGWGRPLVAVSIALDMSASTYENSTFNSPGTISNQQVLAVQAYLQQNARLSRPNQVQIFGFGGAVRPLTNRFSDNSQQIEEELDQALKKASLPQQVIPNKTDVGLAIQEGTKALESLPNVCREILLVTDGEIQGSLEVINALQAVVDTAILRKIRINIILVGGNPAPILRKATLLSRGIFLTGDATDLELLFSQRLFVRFNTNIRWIIFWLGCAWIALMWLIILPLERWILRDVMKLPPGIAGRLAIGNALFWLISTPAVLWRLSGLPLLNTC